MPCAFPVFRAGDGLINELYNKIVKFGDWDALLILPFGFCGVGLLHLHDDLLIVILELREFHIIVLHAQVLVVFEQGIPGVLVAADRISMFLQLQVGLAERGIDVPLDEGEGALVDLAGDEEAPQIVVVQLVLGELGGDPNQVVAVPPVLADGEHQVEVGVLFVQQCGEDERVAVVLAHCFLVH